MTIMVKLTMNNDQSESVQNIGVELVVVRGAYKVYRRQLYHKRNRRVSNYVYRHRKQKFEVLWMHRIRIYKKLYKYKALVPQHEEVLPIREQPKNAAVCEVLNKSISRRVLMTMLSLAREGHTLKQCALWYKKHCNDDDDRMCRMATEYAFKNIDTRFVLKHNPISEHLVEQDDTDDLVPQAEVVCFNPKTDRKNKLKSDKEYKKRDKERHREAKKRPPWFRPKASSLEQQDDDDNCYYTGSIVRCNTDSDDESVPRNTVDPDEVPNENMFEEDVDQREYNKEQYRKECYEKYVNSMDVDEILQFLIKLKFTTIQVTTNQYNKTKCNMMPKLTMDQHVLVKMSENAITTWIALRSSRTWVQFVQILVMYLCVASEHSMSLLLTNYLLSFFEGKMQEQDGDDKDKGENEVTYVLRNLVKCWKDVRHSYLVNSIKKAFAVLVTFGYLQKENIPFDIGKFEHVFKCAETKEFQKLDAVEWMLDFSAFIVEKGVAIYKGDGLMTFFYHDSATMKLQEDYSFVLTNFPLYENGQLGKINIDATEYRNRLYRCLKTMKRLCAFTPKGPELNYFLL